MFAMKRTLAVTTILTISLFGAGCLNESGPTAPTASEVFTPGGQSGVTSSAGSAPFAAVKLTPRGASRIEGQIEFFETDLGVMAVGIARKMDPASRYVTVLFDELSSSDGDACVSNAGPVPYEIGSWRVNRYGRGQLKVVLDPVLLGDFSRIGAASLHLQVGPAHAASELLACGRVKSMK